MKIAIVTTGRFHVLDLARELAALGHDVAFWSAVPRRRAARFGLPASAHRALLPWVWPLMLAQRYGTRWLQRLANGKLLTVVDRLVARWLEPCDVFIGMSGLCVESARVARDRYGAQIFIERGSRHILSQVSILDDLKRRGYPADTVPADVVVRELAGYSIADRVVIPSLHVESSFIEYQFPAQRLFRNPYGVDLDMFRPTQSPAACPPTLLFVGAWSYQKGVDLLLQAREMLGDVTLLHVGPVGDAPLPTTTGFVHVDAVPQWQLRDLYAKAHLFVHASRQEGLSLVQAQALACGLPLVCSDRTGGEDLQRTLADPGWVRVVPSDDVAALAAAIRDMLPKALGQRGNARRAGQGRGPTDLEGLRASLFRGTRTGRRRPAASHWPWHPRTSPVGILRGLQNHLEKTAKPTGLATRPWPPSRQRLREMNKPACVLLVGEFTFDRLAASYKRAFEILGHKVLTFDVAQQRKALMPWVRNRIGHRLTIGSLHARRLGAREYNRRLVEIVQLHAPRMVLAFNGEFIMPEAVRRIREMGVRFCVFHADNPFPPHYNNRPETLPAAKECDLYFVWSRTLVEKLRSIGVRAEFLAFGWDPVSFPFQGFPVEQVHDVTFIGNWDPQREVFLDEVARHFPLKVWGSAYWGTRTRNRGAARRSWQNEALGGVRAAEVMAKSKVNLNILRAQHYSDGVADGVIMRTFEVPGAGAMLLASRSNGAMDMLPEGEAGDYFGDVQECLEKIELHLRTDGRRREIARRAHAVVASGHRYEHRVADVLSFLHR